MVETSDHPDYKPGDQVVLNGWGVGETHLGGYAADAPGSRATGWCRCPHGMTPAQAMAIGTAGYTAMLCLMALEAHGVTPARGPVLVTGAVGRRRLGRDRAAGAGRLARDRLDRPARRKPDYLKGLGAAEIIDRAELTGARQAARQGALGRRRRHRRLDHARQRALA